MKPITGAEMTDRAGRPGVFWPLRTGRIVTSPFGQRGDEWHAGTDFGFPGGLADQGDATAPTIKTP